MTMSKDRHAGTKRNGTASARFPRRGAANGHATYGSRLRFGLAGFLRRSERIVDGMVTKYEKMCSLEDEEAAEIYQSMADDFTRKGDVTQAIDALRRTLEIRPNHVESRVQLGILLLREGATREAAEMLMHARADGCDTFALHFHLGQAYAELERHEASVGELEAALELNPESAEAAYWLGIGLDELGRYEEAVTAFQLAIKCTPRQASYHQSLGFTLESLGRRDEALDCFKRAVSLERRAGRR